MGRVVTICLWLTLGSVTYAQSLDIGVYVKRDTAWQPIEPEVIAVKEGSAFHIYAGSINAYATFHGLASHMSIAETTPNGSAHPMDLLVVAPEGTSATEYQLVRLQLDEKHGSRQVRVNRVGFTGTRSGVDPENVVTFETERQAPRQFVIHIPDLGVGEYALIPPGTPPTKAFTFRVKDSQ